MLHEPKIRNEFACTDDAPIHNGNGNQEDFNPPRRYAESDEDILDDGDDTWRDSYEENTERFD